MQFPNKGNMIQIQPCFSPKDKTGTWITLKRENDCSIIFGFSYIHAICVFIIFRSKVRKCFFVGRLLTVMG